MNIFIRKKTVIIRIKQRSWKNVNTPVQTDQYQMMKKLTEQEL